MLVCELFHNFVARNHGKLVDSVAKLNIKIRNSHCFFLTIYLHLCIETLFCVVDALWLVVLSFKFDQNQLSGYQDEGSKSGFLHYFGLRLTQPCTTVQA